MSGNWQKTNFEAKIRWTFASGFSANFSAEDFENAIPETLISAGRERVEKLKIVRGNDKIECVGKTFPRANFFQRIFSEKRVGTKAQRAFRAAQILREHNIGTPEPLALGEKIDARGNILESQLFTKFVPEMTNFRDEMHRLYAHGNAQEISELMQTVATACRAFHDAGIIHRDLGNQNIGLKKTPAGTWEVIFLDLDRVRIFPAGTLTDAQRGKDLARIDLPSELKTFFLFFHGEVLNIQNIITAENKERKAFAWHSRLRPWRHPIREWKIRKKAKENATGNSVPFGKELWLWDSRSEQPISAYASRERRKFRSIKNIFKMLKGVLLYGNALWKNYKAIAAQSFSVPVDFDKTLGMSIEADSATWEMQIYWLGELENGNVKLPILLRAYHHKGREHWEFLCEKACELHARGNAVAIAFVQDRAAIRVPESWREMVFLIAEKTHDFVDFYEVGHATNRGKWGVWDFQDYTKKLLVPALELKRAFPQIRLSGPACIDFDLHTLAGILCDVPAGTFDFLSQHLYVDRRGAPENFQGKFDLVKKCAVHRAFAKSFAFKNEKIIVSEFNWPLQGKGTWSPCSAFFCGENGGFSSFSRPPHVDETEFAQFSLRYWLLAIASGNVERVYFWRLTHRAFGLVDDADSKNPRPCEAFFAFQKMLAALAGTRFERRVFDVPAGTFALEFSRGNGEHFYISWTKKSFPKISQTLLQIQD